MTSSTYFKLKCPSCGWSREIGVTSADDTLRCFSCSVSLVPDAATQSSADDLECPSCKTRFGMVNSDTCPMCEEPFSTVQ